MILKNTLKETEDLFAHKIFGLKLDLQKTKPKAYVLYINKIIFGSLFYRTFFFRNNVIMLH